MSAVCRILIVVAALMFTVVSHAQIRCATDIIEKKALLKDPNFRTNFEMWMGKKIADQKVKGLIGGRTASAPYVIPVVVHIITMERRLGRALTSRMHKYSRRSG
ncbi:MAG: hypothetical protein WDO15_20705 [Bacteroidota bacterium]